MDVISPRWVNDTGDSIFCCPKNMSDFRVHLTYKLDDSGLEIRQFSFCQSFSNRTPYFITFDWLQESTYGLNPSNGLFSIWLRCICLRFLDKMLFFSNSLARLLLPIFFQTSESF